ncbi:hypothetical protein C6341_g3933 [Phytophthora cactorum]|uniref:Uncharacterized protein n=1 Tax=Phytophthora cactorum TaxID=29920 RepID=A0A8T1EFT9_9STRA|nr:hypothetical protein PC117_g4403 [Phytophthora cactorum]KAG3009886.1 hypothetical protein PC120_g15385 [Phytophthora cactorum]KAG3186255.1 hypothetical protein C6341_g3933 [Phytophthora cactorum]
MLRLRDTKNEDGDNELVLVAALITIQQLNEREIKRSGPAFVWNTSYRGC